jgi:hypothetical protein
VARKVSAALQGVLGPHVKIAEDARITVPVGTPLMDERGITIGRVTGVSKVNGEWVVDMEMED